MIKQITAILLSLIFCVPSYATVRHVVKERVVNEAIISQKVIQFDDFGQLKVIAIPITSYGPQYYYEADRSAILGRKVQLSQEDIDQIIKGVVDGVIDQLEVVDENGQPVTPTPDKPTEPVNPPVGVSEIEANVLGLFQNKCAACHTGSTPKGKLLLVKDDNSMADFTDRQISKILRRTRGGDGLPREKLMPLGDPDGLSDEEIVLLQSWQDERFAQPVAEITENPTP